MNLVPNSLAQEIHLVVNPLPGWTSPERGVEMAELILERKPKVCVEIGVFGGRSLLPQAMALHHLGQGHVYGIDPWRKEAAIEGENPANQDWWSNHVELDDIHKIAVKTIWGRNLEHRCTIIRSESQHVIELFPEIDLLTIDGNHSEIASCRDVELYMPRVVKGGMIACDDLDWPSTQKAKQMILDSCDILKNGGTYGIFVKR